jgi:hypothetical protein
MQASLWTALVCLQLIAPTHRSPDRYGLVSEANNSERAIDKPRQLSEHSLTEQQIELRFTNKANQPNKLFIKNLCASSVWYLIGAECSDTLIGDMWECVVRTVNDGSSCDSDKATQITLLSSGKLHSYPFSSHKLKGFKYFRFRASYRLEGQSELREEFSKPFILRPNK